MVTTSRCGYVQLCQSNQNLVSKSCVSCMSATIVYVLHHATCLLQILPGSRLPVDGDIIAGSSYVDEAMVTGEPIPVDKHVGDAVICGTLNGSGTFIMQATRVGADTTLNQVYLVMDDMVFHHLKLEMVAHVDEGNFSKVLSQFPKHTGVAFSLCTMIFPCASSSFIDYS